MLKFFKQYILIGLSLLLSFNLGVASTVSSVSVFSSKKEVEKSAVAFAVFGGAATGMATETGKQYDLAVRRLEKRGGSYTIEKVLQEINWAEVLKQGAITGFSTYIVTHPKYGALVKKIKSRLKIQNLTSSAGINQLKKYFKKRLAKAGSKIASKYKIAIFDKLKVISKDNSLSKWIKESFLDSYYYTVKITEDIPVFRRFGGGETQAKLFGGFASTKTVLKRSELSVLKKWSTMRFEAELVIQKGAKLNVGKIARQGKYKGGADQIFLPQNYPESWVKNITDLKTKKVYTLAEFKKKFPKQVKKK